jgi:tetraacyldisaccharide 4'-kinase
LYPLSLLYGVITWARNRLYDQGVLTEIEFDIPTIAVGNLSVGGTGKTPHVEYLIRLLSSQYHVATLSRGYNRETRGYLFAGEHSTARTIGDEPMLFHLHYDVAVGVGERRALALPQLLMDAPDTEVVLLDDAFQHRSIKPGLNIMVTEYRHLFTRDHIVPFGRLRESRAGYQRADCVIVSKCPGNMSSQQRKQLREEIRPQAHQQLFFTHLKYGSCYEMLSGEREHILPDTRVMVVCGIADPAPLLDYLATLARDVRLLRFPDHHYFTADDLDRIEDGLSQLGDGFKMIVTTEKDAVRLALLEDQLVSRKLSLYVMPLEVAFLFSEKDIFDEYIFNYVNHARIAQFNT